VSNQLLKVLYCCILNNFIPKFVNNHPLLLLLVLVENVLPVFVVLLVCPYVVNEIFVVLGKQIFVLLNVGENNIDLRIHIVLLVNILEFEKVNATVQGVFASVVVD